MLSSEKRSLIYFLTLYSIITTLLLTALATLYYKSEKELMLEREQNRLRKYANELILRLKKLHINFDRERIYPRDRRFKSAIFDSDREVIFSIVDSEEFDLDKSIYKIGEYIHYIKGPESYYLGAKYLLLEVRDSEVWLNRVQREIAIYGGLTLFLIILIGFFLLKLFLKPMRDSIFLLDRFIKDTTHELNTPVSTILTNIEMIDREKLTAKESKRLNRIDIASRVISNIYQDLTYLTLNHKTISRVEKLNISTLLSQRVDYFRALIESKRLNLELNILENIYMDIDRVKFTKLLDNLISNSIKYNQIKGLIQIELKDRELKIANSSRNIPKSKLREIFKRYQRLESEVGGFGIGLSIVSAIAYEFNLELDIDSKDEITTVWVKW